MARWAEVEAAVPELAAAARGFFDAGLHKTIATLRRDGGPRISGTEINFGDEDAWFGSMWRATKALDLQRDPRFALHSASFADPWKGDAKIAGAAREVTDRKRKVAIMGGKGAGDPFHLFVADIAELVVVRVADPPDHLIIESWHEGRGYHRVERR